MSNGSLSRSAAHTDRAPRRVRIHGRFFSLEVVSAKQAALRWTCIVSRRVARKAVDRNCIKRWCREAARTYAKHTGDTAALVFRAKKEAFHAEFADVKNDVRTLVEKYGSTVYNNPQ